MQFFARKHAKKLTPEQRLAAALKFLENDYPVALAIVSSIIKIPLVLAVVTLQSLAYYFKSPFYYTAVG